MFTIDFDFNHQDVLFDHSMAPLAVPLEYRSRVENHWKEVNSDGRFFNGKVLTAANIQTTTEPPTVKLAITDYAHYLYAAADPSHQIDCRAVYCAAVVITSDEYLLFGQMGLHTSSPGQIQCPGGNIEIGADNGVDARVCCQREISEEVGAAFWSDRLWFRPMCIKTGGKNATIGLFYALRLESNVEEALSMFDEHQAALTIANEKPELETLHAVKLDPTAVRKFCDDHKGALVDYLRPLFLDRLEQVGAVAQA